VTHSLPILDPGEARPVPAASVNHRYVTEALDQTLAAEVGRSLAKQRRGRRSLFPAFFRSRT
jgi:hypothetical protein